MVTVLTEPAVTSTSSIAGAALACLAVTWWWPGVAQTSSGSGASPTLLPSTLTSALPVSQSIRIRPSFFRNSATDLFASAIISGDASAAPAKNFSKASRASTGRLRSRLAWPMLNISLAMGKRHRPH